MTKPTSPDLLDLAEAVAAGKLGAADAERQVRVALGPERGGASEEAETAIRDLRRLVVAARAVRAHAFATRGAFGDQGTELAQVGTSVGIIAPSRVRPGAVRRGSSPGGGGGRASRRTWLLVAATLLVGTGVVGASIVGGRLIAPNPSPTAPVAVVNPSASPSANPTSLVAPARAASWTGTGSMTTPRMQQAATLLPDGKVLVVGGYHPNVPSSYTTADVYDPSTGTWTVTGRMTEDRLAGLTVTLLRDGKVLVAGGQRGWTPSAGDGTLASAELYDPATGTWTATGSMTTPRMGHTATLLSDGRVLVAGGEHYVVGDVAGGSVALASAELYDPGTGTWTATGSMATPRASHAAVLLPNGQVLVVGDTTAELYDPGTAAWTATGSMATPRGWFTATLLTDGKVLVAGGHGGSTGTLAGTLASAELYDPGTGTWAATGSMGTPRASHTATLLPGGRVLIAAGASVLRWGGDDLLASAELYDPSTGTWTATASMVAPRESYTATLLPDGRVLVAGGKGGTSKNEWQPTAELYDPGSP
jgi:Galactose oxidase, central domain/Kelch motif